MPAGAIHFVTETGQADNGVPGKKRLSRINSHVARFSHNRRKNNKNGVSASNSRTSSPLQVDFVMESPRTDDSRSSSDSPTSITSYPAQLLSQDMKVPDAVLLEPPVRRRSTGSPGSNRLANNPLARHHSAPVDVPSPADEDAGNSKVIVRRRSEEPHSFGPVPRIGSLGSPLQLGNSVNLYEKYLLNYYFTELPNQMFGFHKDALYCPYRTDAARTIQRSPSALHWILVIAEQQMNQHAPEPSKSVILSQSILKRRADGYGILRSLLNNPNFDLEEAIITLRYAISAECYVSNAGACKEHLKALDALMQQPGILELFASNIDRTALSLASLIRGYVNAPIGIKSASDFDNIKTLVFDNFRHLQALSIQNHAELVRHATTTYLMQADDHDLDELAKEPYASKPISLESLLGRYISVKKTTLFSTYTLQAMNTTCHPQMYYAFQAGLLTLFYGLNLTLASFGKHNLADKIMFLQRLKSVLDGSSERSLGASAIRAVVDRVREQYYSECYGKAEMIRKEVELCHHEINVLKIFVLLDGESRTRLTTAVRAWLLSDVSMDISIEDEDLTEDEMGSMEEQVTTAWWKEHLTSKSSNSPALTPEPL